MSDIENLTKKVIDFRNKRRWKQFHNPKDVALSLALEAGEVMEHFQWKSSEEIKEYLRLHKSDIAEEIADVFYWVLLMSHDLKIDLKSALESKIEKNNNKYPVNKAKGKHLKYTEL